MTALWQLAEPPLYADLPPIDRDAGGRPFRFRQAVRSYELGPKAAALPQAILQWLEHAVFRAVPRAGWHHEIRRADGTLVRAERARGAFLELDGGIRQAAAELLDDLRRGESTD